jgi:hypothetical protein
MSNEDSARDNQNALLRFVLARADEDEAQATASNPVDQSLMDVCDMARLAARRFCQEGARLGACRALVAAAITHAGHPDFRSSWRGCCPREAALV